MEIMIEMGQLLELMTSNFDAFIGTMLMNGTKVYNQLNFFLSF